MTISVHFSCGSQDSHGKWLWHWTRDSTFTTSIPGRRDKYWDGWPSSGWQTTSVFHQATQANSASYLQRDEVITIPKCGDASRLHGD